MRQRLLDAAVKVIMSRGYLGFTMVEAAKVAGVSRGAPNHHFRTADGFLLAALEHLFAQRQRANQQTIAHLSGNEAFLKALAADAKNFFFSQGFFAGLDVLLSATKDARTRMAVRELGHRYRVTNEEMWCDRLVELGYSPADAKNAVWMLLAIVRGLGLRTLLKHDPAHVNRMIELGTSMVGRMLEGRRSDPKVVPLKRPNRSQHDRGAVG